MDRSVGSVACRQGDRNRSRVGTVAVFRWHEEIRAWLRLKAIAARLGREVVAARGHDPGRPFVVTRRARLLLVPRPVLLGTAW